MRKLKVTEMNRLTVDEFKSSEKMPLTVVLDDVRSMYNVGSVLRSCDAFRVEAVWLCGITAVRPIPRYTRRRWAPRTAWSGATSLRRSTP